MFAKSIRYFDDNEFLYQRLALPSNIVSALEDSAMSLHGRFGLFLCSTERLWADTFEWAVKVLRNRVNTSALAIGSRLSDPYSF
jgi:hypothetical protein